MIGYFASRGLLLIAVVGLAACGSSGDAASDASDRATSGGNDGSTNVGGGSSAPEVTGDRASIMFASALDPGVIEVEVDGEIHEFRRDDPEQTDFEFAVSEERVRLAFQSTTNDHAMLLEFADASLVGGADGRFAGRATIEPRSLESGFYGAEQPEIDADFIDREPPCAFVVLDAAYAESRSDLEYDSVGTMIVRANCGSEGGDDAADDDGTVDDDGTAAALPSGSAGTPDADGHAATFELLTESVSYDFGAVVSDITCGAAGGLARASGSTDVPSGVVGFGAFLYNPGDVAEQFDLPYILIQDDEVGVGWVAGRVPERASIDPGGSAVYQVTITDDGFEATGGFIEIGGDPLALIPGTIRVSCP